MVRISTSEAAQRSDVPKIDLLVETSPSIQKLALDPILVQLRAVHIPMLSFLVSMP
jgi:hypothetical protein